MSEEVRPAASPGVRPRAVWIAAGALSAALAGDAAAGETSDVQIRRAGSAVYIEGGSASDSISITAGANAGEFRVIGQFGTTVNSESQATVVVPPKGRLVVALAGGYNFVGFEGAIPKVKEIRVASADGFTSVDFTDATIDAKVRADGGDSGVSVVATRTEFKGTFQFYGGDGVDTLYASGCTFRKPLTMRAGVVDPNSKNSQGLTLRDTVADKPVVFVGSAGQDVVTLFGCELRSKLGVSTLGGGDRAELFDSSVAGTSVVLLGDGFDQLFSDEFVANGAVRIDGGPVTDDMQISRADFRRGGSVAGGDGDDNVDVHASTNARTLRIGGGIGNDTVRVESTDTVVSVARADVIVDGGPGTDTLVSDIPVSLVGGAKFRTSNFE